MISGVHYSKALLLACAWLLLLFQEAKAQRPSTVEMPHDSLLNKDSLKAIKFLIVPFNPAMYFSDADQDIAEISKINPHQVKERFSGSLEGTMNEQLALYYTTKRLSKQPGADTAMDIIFGSIDYKVSETKSEKPESSAKKIKDKFLENKAPEKSNKIDYKVEVMAQPALMQYLSTTFKAEYFLFITQFEIVTDYKNCLDLANRIYYREIRVHYTVLNAAGKTVNNGSVVLPYQNSENQIDNIIRDNFNQISTTLLQRIYHRK